MSKLISIDCYTNHLARVIFGKRIQGILQQECIHPCAVIQCSIGGKLIGIA